MNSIYPYAIAIAISTAAMLANANTAAPEFEKPPIRKIRSISLSQVQELAIKHNPSLKNLDETIYKADTKIRSAWSILLPRARANASITRNQYEIAMEFPADLSTAPPSMTEVVIQEKWGKSFGVQANMTLFNPCSIPVIKNAYDAADRTRLVAQKNKNDLLFAVTSAYYQIHSLKELVNVARESLSLASEFQVQSKALLSAGQATNIDVMRAELEVVAATKKLENSKDSLVTAQTALGYLIGETEPFDISSPKQVPQVIGHKEGLTERALSNRVEMKAVALDEQMAIRSKTETMAKWLPTFDMTYNWSWNSSAGFSGEKDSWMLLFGANWSIFEGGARIAEAQSRSANIRMATNARNQLTLDVQQDVDQNFLKMGNSKRNVELADKQVELAQANHNVVTKQYSVGISSSLDVVSASTELAQNRTSRVIEHLSYDLAILSLRKAIGEYHTLSAVAPR